MRFRILGPLHVQGESGPVRLGGPRQQTVLATLLLEAGRVVPIDRLVAALWDEAPPATAREQVQICVSALRRVLATAGLPRDLIVTQPPGYRMLVEEGDLDVAVFERHVAKARAAMVERRVATAASELHAALELWQGPPLGGISSRVVQTAAVRLEERRLAVVEQRLELDLSLGRHAELVAELTAMVAEHPLREGLRGQLMVALYRCGRQAEALRVYQQGHRMLAEELGLEPGAALRRLQQAILTADPSLDAAESADDERPPTASTASTAASRRTAVRKEFRPSVLPCQLPPDVASFTGRREELGQLTVLLEAVGGGAPVVVAAVDGPPGVGKSALAVRAAHRVTGRFPDGCLYIDLHGSTTGLVPVQPDHALGWFLRALGVDGREIPGKLEEQAALFRSLLTGRRMLVVLDNAEDAAQARPLLPAGPGCAAIVTSRRVLATLETTACLHLGMLGLDESVELLQCLAGPARVAAEPEAATTVARLCGQLPLALRIAGARLAARPAWPVRTLAERLADERRRLDELQLADLAIRGTFQLTYRGLDARAAEPRRHGDAEVFRLLGLLAGPDAGVPVAARLLDRPLAATETALERLVDAQLLESHAPGRYRMHDLVRLFAQECAAREEPPARRRAALLRALEFYLATATLADRLLRPSRLGGNQAAAAAGEGEVLADRKAALAWLDLERANLVTAVQQAGTAPGIPPAVCGRLATTLFGLFELRGYLDDGEHACRAALAHARRVGDQRAEAQAHRDLGVAASCRHQPDRAWGHLARSLALRRRLDDRHGRAVTLNALHCVYLELGRLDKAIHCLERSRALFGELGDRAGEALTVSNLGNAYRAQGRHDLALVQLRRGLALRQESGDRLGEAATLNSLGGVYEALGRHDQAAGCYQDSLALCEELGDRRHMALNLDSLGGSQRLQGQAEHAIACHRQSLELHRELANRHGQAQSLRLLGVALDALGQQAEARASWREALAIFEELALPEAGELRALLGQGV